MALQFVTGSSHRVSANGVTSGSVFGGAHTIIGRGQLSAWAANRDIFAAANAAHSYSAIDFSNGDQKLHARTNTAVGENVVDSAVFTNNSARHLFAILVDAAGHINHFYIDLADQGNDSTFANDLSGLDWFDIGQIPWNGEGVNPWHGRIEEVRVYNRELTFAEITIIYYAQGADNIVNGLIGRWLMNEKADGQVAAGANVVIDISGQGNHGTPANNPVYRGAPLKLVRPFVTMTRIAETYTETLTRKLGFVPSHISVVESSLTKKLGFVPSFVLGPYGLSYTMQLGFVPSQVSTIYGEKILKLGVVPSHISTITATPLIKKLGFVPRHVSTAYGELLKKLGLVPSHSSTIYGTELLKLGFVPDYTSIVYGLLTKKLGFVPIHISQVYKYIVELKFYDRDDNLVKIISSKTKNFPLVDPPGLDFQWFRDGGCGPFSFAVSEDLGLEYNYKCEIYLWETKWYTGYITKLPQVVGTQIVFNYAGWGYSEQIDWQTIKETYVGTELSAIAEDILDNYIIGKTKVKKAA